MESPSLRHAFIFIEKRDYTKFFLSIDKKVQETPDNFDPLKHKLLDQDELMYSECGEKVELIQYH